MSWRCSWPRIDSGVVTLTTVVETLKLAVVASGENRDAHGHASRCGVPPFTSDITAPPAGAALDNVTVASACRSTGDARRCEGQTLQSVGRGSGDRVA